MLVWYRHDDYAGIGRRLVACLIDAAIMLAVLATPGFFVSRMHLAPNAGQEAHPVGRGTLAVFGLALTLLIATPYHLVLRRTRGGTIGYRLAGIRLTTMMDTIPEWGTLARRFALSIILPLAFYAVVSAGMAAQSQPTGQRARPPASMGQAIGSTIMAAIIFAIVFGNYWIVIRDPRRQALHDKWSRTWVARKAARPAGIGRPIERAWILGPLVLPYWDVEPIESAEAAAVAG